MSTNPNNAVGTNAAYSGRTSVNAFNDDLAAYTSGILSGWACMPSSGLTITLGGEADTRDVAIAQDSAGNKTTINNISGSPISVTIGTPPASNSRIDAVVAYVDNPPEGVASTADNPAACGLITVEGTAAATPTAPNESAIRTAITADGASGSTAYYVVLALVTVASGATDITSNDIAKGPIAQIDGVKITDKSISADQINFSTFGTTLAVSKGSSDNLPSITMTPPADGRILLLAISLCTWGYAGMSAYLNITNPSGATQVTQNGGHVDGGDKIGRQMTAFRVVEVTGGNTYSFGTQKVNQFGNSFSIALMGMWFPG